MTCAILTHKYDVIAFLRIEHPARHQMIQPPAFILPPAAPSYSSGEPLTSKSLLLLIFRGNILVDSAFSSGTISSLKGRVRDWEHCQQHTCSVPRNISLTLLSQIKSFIRTTRQVAKIHARGSYLKSSPENSPGEVSLNVSEPNAPPSKGAVQ